MQSFADTQERLVPMRLQKFLARAGVASRRGSEGLITSGRVSVNGIVVTELGSKVDPTKDTVVVDGREVRLSDTPTTIMLYKPKGYMTSMSDPHARHCISELMPLDAYPGLFPIGRLDVDTTGLLLCSTDGELGNCLLHPRHHVVKRYLAYVEGTPSASELKALESGIMLEDGPTGPARAQLLPRPKGLKSELSYVSLSISEGRKHQVKRMWEAVGHHVVHLHRSEFGPLRLGGLKPGEWRKLSDAELDSLYEAAFGRAVAGPATKAKPKKKRS